MKNPSGWHLKTDIAKNHSSEYTKSFDTEMDNYLQQTVFKPITNALFKCNFTVRFSKCRYNNELISFELHATNDTQDFINKVKKDKKNKDKKIRKKKVLQKIAQRGFIL